MAIASLTGSMLTLIGTPPNLVVNQTLIEAGWPGFHFFDFTLIGGVILVVGIGYMLTLGRRLLPCRRVQEPTHRRKWLHEMVEQYGIETNLHRFATSVASPVNTLILVPLVFPL